MVGVSRFLIQDFWPVMAKDFMALMTPTDRTVPHSATRYVGVSHSDCYFNRMLLHLAHRPIAVFRPWIQSFRGISDIADLVINCRSKEVQGSTIEVEASS